MNGKAREHDQCLSRSSVSNERIWRATLTNRRDLSTNVRNFLWKLIHSAHKCGPYWSRIPNLSERSLCTICDTPESMLGMSRSPVGPVRDQDQTGTGPNCMGPRSGPSTVPRWSGPGPGLAWISGTALGPDGTGPGPDQC